MLGSFRFRDWVLGVLGLWPWRYLDAFRRFYMIPMAPGVQLEETSFEAYNGLGFRTSASKSVDERRFRGLSRAVGSAWVV